MESNPASHALLIKHNGNTISFEAKIDESGRMLEVFPKDGQCVCILIGLNLAPLETVMPSIDGDVISCFHEGGCVTYVETLTGQALEIKQLIEKGTRFLM